MRLSLLVIRSPQPQQLADFYGCLGLGFEYHQHGNAPFHYSGRLGELVLEIYPLAKNQPAPDTHLRLGFVVGDLAEVLEGLAQYSVGFTPPTRTEFGVLSIITDPDGRKIELYQK